MAWGSAPNPKPYFTGGANTFAPPVTSKAPTIAFKPLPVAAPSKVVQTAAGTAFKAPLPVLKPVPPGPSKPVQSFPTAPAGKSAADIAKAAATAAQKAAEEKIKAEAAAKLEAARKALMNASAAAQAALYSGKPAQTASDKPADPAPAPAPASSTLGVSNTMLALLAAVGLFFALPWIRKAF